MRLVREAHRRYSVLPHELRHLLRRHALDEVVVDQHRRREAARAEALDLDHGPLAVGTRRPQLAGAASLAGTPSPRPRRRTGCTATWCRPARSASPPGAGGTSCRTSPRPSRTPASATAPRPPPPCCGRRSSRARAAPATAPGAARPASWGSAPRIVLQLARSDCAHEDRLVGLACPAGTCVRRSPIHLPHHDVDRRVDRDQVRQQVSLGHLRDAREVDERGRPDAPAHRLRRAVGHEVVAQLALGVLDRPRTPRRPAP